MLATMPNSLPPGLYESLVTLGLRDAIEELERQGSIASLDAIDEVLISDILADHVRDAARRSLGSLTGDAPDRLAASGHGEPSPRTAARHVCIRRRGRRGLRRFRGSRPSRGPRPGDRGRGRRHDPPELVAS